MAKKEELRAKMQEMREEIKEWAEENDIDLKLIDRKGFGDRHGFGYRGDFRKAR